MNGTKRPLSQEHELRSLSSFQSTEPLVPLYYRREQDLRSPELRSQSRVTGRESLIGGHIDGSRNISAGGSIKDDGEGDRVFYPPIPEENKLGYFSTSALIISKVIGTGVFAKPSIVLANSGGKGLCLGLWFVGGLMSLAGLIIYVELGMALPYSGGEIVYVDEAFPRPRYLAVIVISLLFVLLTHWAANCIAFARLILQAFEPDNPNPSYHLQKFVALVMVTTVCAVHMSSRNMGIALNNFLAIYKVSLVLFIIFVGFAAMAGARTKSAAAESGSSGYGLSNISPKELARTEERSMLEYANAILGVLWAYTGWENANYVLGEVKRPPGRESRVFKVAAFSSIGTLTALYILANVAYFTVLTTEELLDDGDITAAKFFVKVFGHNWFSQRALKVLVSLSVLGNFFSSTYSVVRVKQEIGKLRILPFSKFWARQKNGVPFGGLVLHWLVCAIVIIVTPYNKNDEAYNLVTDLFTYGQSYMLILVSVGVVTFYYMPHHNWVPALFRWPILVSIVTVYVSINLFVLVITWWPAKHPEEREIPSFATPGVATGIIVLGGLYWIGFAKVLPALGYQIDSSPDEVVDGNRVVTYKRTKTGFAIKVDSWWRRNVSERLTFRPRRRA